MCVAAAQAQPPQSVTVDGAITLVESAQAPGAVRIATADLRRDFAKVFGREPRLVDSLSQAGPVAILIAGNSELPPGLQCSTTAVREAFAFSIASEGVGPTHKRVVCLTGADMRGTIYAVYQFSQQVLGVDPMYLWTGKQPARRTRIVLGADFAHVFPGPLFRYRGFFLNDEDLLSGWRLAPRGAHTQISLKVWDNVFETILRLKGNMVVPGTWIFPDDAQVEAASRRGLIVNQHHATPLGVNVARWPRGVPYNFSTHPEILKRAWTNAVAEYKPDDDILWTVGLRGLSDQSYAQLDPSVKGNDKLLGTRVSEAIAGQIAIVRTRFPHAQFITNLWQEGARLEREGYLKIPPEVTEVWPDTGYGDLQDHGEVRAGQGAYFHVAMMNGQANQLSEMVPVSVIQKSLGRYIRAGATGYLLLNTSDIRPVAMTAREVMDIAWGGLPRAATDADGAYYRAWAAQEFGAASAVALEGVYKGYFAALPVFHWAQLHGASAAPKPGPYAVPHEIGDQHYHSEARRLILQALTQGQVIDMPSQSPKWTRPGVMREFPPEMEQKIENWDVQMCTDAEPGWNAEWKRALAAEKTVAPARRNYYQAQVLTMISINRESNRMLLDVTKAVEAGRAGDTAKALAGTSDALIAIDAMQAQMRAAEYGKWKNWYRGDWLTGVYRTRQLVQDYANALRDPMAKLPAPMEWSGWEAYFHIMRYEGDRTVDVQ
ncbi:MAG TPA: glycosyl hydrolase 115 family protein [Terracidiphilus sp.]|nr:glycosyl hydrolase 115 family protein [Terracidiphilus sp.]